MAFLRLALPAIAFALTCGPLYATELDPAAVTFTLPDKVKWEGIPGFPGAERAVMIGDPSKPGFYAVMIKWLPGNHFSRPHFHPHDRFITVLKGTWWVGSGPVFDKDKTTPVPAGSFVVHHPNQIHWDGAKDEEAVVQIMGVGPSATVRVDEAGRPKQ